jgi:hypothetical protein
MAAKILLLASLKHGTVLLHRIRVYSKTVYALKIISASLRNATERLFREDQVCEVVYACQSAALRGPIDIIFRRTRYQNWAVYSESPRCFTQVSRQA